MASRLNGVSTSDVAMAVKEFVEECLATAEIIVLISLHVNGAFDTAWWPRILNRLKAYNCTQNFINYLPAASTNGLQSSHLTISAYREQSPKGPRKDPAAGQDTGIFYTIPY